MSRLFHSLLTESGRIILVTSEVAYLDPMPFNGLYSVSKTALECYAQALRQEINLLDQKVITIRPGAIKTPLCDGSLTDTESLAAATELYKKLSQKDFQVSDEELSAAISAHKNFGFSNFTYTDNGFTASIDNVSHDRNIAYFSVPYDNGWTAMVNCQATEIINSSGMMAIPLTEGSNEVVFTYRTPGFTAGAVISAVCLVVAVGYCVVGTFLKKKRGIDNE